MIKTPHKPSKEVLEFATIADDARAMSKLLQTYVSPGIGRGPEHHYALHHSQYSMSPYNFFVIAPRVVGAGENDIVVIVNPQIIEKVKDTHKFVGEACMSFPFRHAIKVRRYDRIKVRYQVPDTKGEKLITKEEEATGFLAQIFQHEDEHRRGSHIYAARPLR